MAKKEVKCEACGALIKQPDEMGTVPLKSAGPKRWCNDCIWKGLYWGLERYTDAVKQ